VITQNIKLKSGFDSFLKVLTQVKQSGELDSKSSVIEGDIISL